MRKFRKVAAFFVSCSLVVPIAVHAQSNADHRASAPPAKAVAREKKANEIRGRVIPYDGMTLPLGFVRLRPAGKSTDNTPSNTVPVQPDGRFRFVDVPPGAYGIRFETGWLGFRYSVDSTDRFYRPGGFAEIRLTKGSVITGRVVDATGNPLVNVDVQATMVRDDQGRPEAIKRQSGSARTDDRGIYRLFRLSAGSYIVGVGTVLGTSPYAYADSDVITTAPTYYPSASFENAREVAVAAGREASGIDIRLRGEAGHAVTGRVISPFAPDRRERSATIRMARMADGSEVAKHYFNLTEDGAFSIAHVPDGEYVAWAEMATGAGRAISRPVPVKVKGADVNAIAFDFFLYGTISGRVKLAESAAVPGAAGCDGPLASPAEFALRARPNTPNRADRIIALQDENFFAVNDDGTFKSNLVVLGLFRLEVDFPNARYYLRSISRANPNGALVDLRRLGVAVASGEQVENVLLTVADRAAGISGRIIRPKNVSGATISRLHLVPAESANGDDFLLYRELEIDNDGTFAFTNLAPGRYFLYAEPLALATPSDLDGVPAAWDPAARAKLRRAAESANVSLELKPCQRVDNFTLRLPAKP